jgi:hypothetical protein
VRKNIEKLLSKKLARKGKTWEKLERKQRRIRSGNGSYEKEIMKKNKNKLYFFTVSGTGINLLLTFKDYFSGLVKHHRSSDFFVDIIRSLFTVHSAMVYDNRFVDIFRAGPGWNSKLSTNLYDIHNCCVYSE